MVRALQVFAKKRKKLPRIKQSDTAYNPITKHTGYRDMTKHEQKFDTKWRMGNAEIRLRELLGHNYRN